MGKWLQGCLMLCLGCVFTTYLLIGVSSPVLIILLHVHQHQRLILHGAQQDLKNAIDFNFFPQKYKNDRNINNVNLLFQMILKWKSILSVSMLNVSRGCFIFAPFLISILGYNRQPNESASDNPICNLSLRTSGLRNSVWLFNWISEC